MKNLLFSLLLFLYHPLVLACPMCAGASPEKKTQYTTYILISFIALVYIPFIIIFRTIKKHSHDR